MKNVYKDNEFLEILNEINCKVRYNGGSNPERLYEIMCESASGQCENCSHCPEALSHHFRTKNDGILSNYI